MKVFFSLLAMVILLFSCTTSPNKFQTPEGIKIRSNVDEAVVALDSSISDFKFLLRIDHSRLAEAEEVFTPPSVVSFFSNPGMNSRLLKNNQLIGIDLPYKVLCYSEPDLIDVSVAYTSADFIRKRHGLSADDLSEYSNDMRSALRSFQGKTISQTNLESVDKNYGLLKMSSDYDFKTTVANLKKSILAQGDTQIFHEIDFQVDAKRFSIEIDPTLLILFGAPAPGGKAMKNTPKIGLDAFCQKLLVFEKENEVFIAFNDIVEFSKLYYQESSIPQRVVNRRLKSVFKEAIKNE